MTTQNPRVAGYIPSVIHDRFKLFKEERGIKGDSQALAVMMAEFFGVNHHVAQGVDYSSFVTKEEFLDLTEKVSKLSSVIEACSLPSSILGKLPERLRKIESRIGSLETTAEELEGVVSPVSNNEPHPGQMSLLGSSIQPLESTSELVEDTSEPPRLDSDSSQSSLDGELQPMNGRALSNRFGLNTKAVSNKKGRLWKNNPEKFIEWTRESDPSGVAWRYSQEDELYHPITK